MRITNSGTKCIYSRNLSTSCITYLEMFLFFVAIDYQDSMAVGKSFFLWDGVDLIAKVGLAVDDGQNF